jgi:transcriptional regulator with XRE-family HTH domain
LALDGGLSQEGMVARLGLGDEIDRTYISRYEAGVLEPPLRVLLLYAELAGVHLEVLADDALLLPDKMPSSPKIMRLNSDKIRHRQSTLRSSNKKRKK